MGKILLGHSDRSGNFKLDVARGVYPNVYWVDKFGANFEINTTDVSKTDPKTVWEFGREFGYTSNSQYIYLPWNGAADPINTLSSSDAADTMDMLVQGLDFTGSIISQVVTMNGQTPVLLTTPLWRIFRMVNIDLDLVTGFGQQVEGIIYCYQGSAGQTNGVPNDGDKVKAVIDNGFSQTQMCTYTIPKGLTGYLMEGEAGVSRTSTDLSVDMCYRSRRFGGAMTVKKSFAVTTHGSSNFADERSVFDIIPELTDIELCVTRTSANGIGVWGTFDILLIDEAAEASKTNSAIIAGMR